MDLTDWEDDPSCPDCWDTLNGSHICRPEHLDHVRRYNELLAGTNLHRGHGASEGDPSL